MNKLSFIRKVLEENQGVVVKSVEQNYLPHNISNHDWAHEVYFCVAPKIGIYDAEKLQDFMLSLIPEIKPNYKNNFQELSERWISDKQMYFGQLCFDEEIGVKIKRINLTKENCYLIDDLGKNQNTFEEKRKLERRIFVKLYPDIQIANLCFSSSKTSIWRNKLDKYDPKFANKKGIFARLFVK